VTAKTAGEEQTPLNRYYRQSLVWPGQFAPDANRSFVLMPAGKPRGAVVLLHGLTDSPYSVRHLAVNYQQHGFVAVVPRLPGHGTAPGALTDVDWEMWLAATRLPCGKPRVWRGITCRCIWWATPTAGRWR
jgi:alpha-beta hydrolase superfamily lysophospholipase